VKTLLVVVAVVALSVAGVYAYVERPWVDPCEQFRQRCEIASASGDLRLSMACTFYYMGTERLTQDECREVVRRLDQRNRGK